MKIWDILEIEETKDKDAIAAAYRAKLVKTHPEDDPEGFMELRRAFEEAVAAADRVDSKPEETSEQEHWGDGPVGEWMVRVDEVYNTFSKRKNPEEWNNLLQDDVCINLDTKIQARTALLKYFLTHYFLPQKVLVLLDQHFGFIENMDELAEEFPRNYLEIIIVQGMNKQEYPPYEYLTGDDSCDFDEYLKLGIQLSQCISSGNTEKGFDIADMMKATGIDNPFLEIDYTKVLCQAERFDEAGFWLEDLMAEYPEIDDVYLMMGDVSFFKNDYDASMDYYVQILEKDPESEWALQGKAKCLVRKGLYKEANEIFSGIMEDNPYDMDSAAWLKECNNLYIADLKEKIKESDDQSLMMDLGWCYYQNEEYDQAIALMQYVDPEEEHKIEYESLLGRCALYADRYVKSIKHLQNWEELLHNLPDSEENREKIKSQLPFCVMLQSYAWGKNNNPEKAMELTERAIELDPKDPEPVIHKGEILSKQWRLPEAVEAFTKAIELNPGAHGPYVMRARALYYMGYYGDAFNDCEKTLEIFQYELAAYVYKVKILIEVGQFDAADEIIAYLESEEISGNELEFLKGFILEARGEKEAAREIYQAILDGPVKKENDIFYVHDFAEVYYHLAVIQYRTPGSTYGQVEELLDKGLMENPREAQLLEMKAEISAERKLHKKALETYEKLAEIAPGRVGIYGAMDTLYRELEEWDKALENAEKQLEQTPTGYAHMRRGQLYAYLNRNEEAERDFRTAMHLAPEMPYPYNYMGVLMESYEREDEALELYKKAIETGERENDICLEAYHNAGNIYCRKNEFVSAEMVLRRGYDKTGDSALLYEQILVLRRSGDFDDAEALLGDYKIKEGLHEVSPKYIVEKAHICRERGMTDEALEMYEEISQVNFDAALEAGKIYYYRGEYKKALEYMQLAIDGYRRDALKQDNAIFLAEFYLWAAKAATDGGFSREARELALEGLELIPVDYDKYESCIPMLDQMQGGLYTVLGNYTQAEIHLQRALKNRKCDYCVHGYCIDACYEMIYLCLLMGRREEALEYLSKGTSVDPVDTDFRKIKEQIEKGKR